MTFSMTVIILLSIVNLLFVGIACGCLFKIRTDVDDLSASRGRQDEMARRILRELVSREQMDNYLSEINKLLKEMHRLKYKTDEKKWNKFEQAFGGPSEEA